MSRKLREIAVEIAADWKNMPEYARAYVRPMATLDSIDEMYGYDSAKSIVLYFLGNARSWRGDTAKRIKNELKEMCK